MIVELLLYCFCHSVVSAQLIWNSRLLSDVNIKLSNNELEIVDITIRQKKLVGYSGCIYDPIVIDWRTNTSCIDEIHVAIFVDGHDEIAIGALLHAEASPSPSKKVSAIKCILNEEHCIPSVGNIMATTKGDPIISVYFNEDTNEPLLSSTKLILSALSINPPLIGKAVGTWLNSKTLQIVVDETYLAAVIEAYTTGQSSSISISPKFDFDSLESRDDDKGDDAVENRIGGIKYTAVRKKGHVVLHPTAHGVTKIFFINATSLSAVSSVLSYDVKLCGEYFVPPLVLQQQRDSEKRMIDGINRNRPPVAAIHIKGVLSVSGKDSVKIPHHAVPALVRCM